jgi:AcrR family transcriptional regulator
MQLALPRGRTYHKRIAHSTYPVAAERPLRRDARENRERILVAARAAFAELGIDVSVEEIARRAGVGVGTLYRRFPTKDALIDAVFERHLDRIAASAEGALADPDAWSAFLGYLTDVVRLQANDCGLSQILGAQLRAEDLVSRARTRLRPLVEQLIARAQEAGELRLDVVYEDISVLLWTTGRVVDATRDVEPDFWQRYLALLVDGLRAGSATPLPRPPLSAAKHRRAMNSFAEHRSRTIRA